MSGILGSLGQIVNLALELYSWLIIIRVLISWVNPDPYNPVVQFLVRATEPVLYPIRRRLPSLGGLDLSPIVVLLLIFLLQRLASVLLQGHGGGLGQLGVELIYVLHLLGTLYLVVLLIRGGINFHSWRQFRRGRPFRLDLHNPGAMFLYQATEPVLRLLRPWLPAPRGLDLSPLVAALLMLALLLLLQESIALLAPARLALPSGGLTL